MESNINENEDIKIITQQYGQEGNVEQFRICKSKNTITPVKRKNSQNSNKPPIWFTISNLLYEVFLPKGYPGSVSKDYLSYQLWDTMQAFCSSITGILATQGILKGVGVGNETATALAATITWLLKSGTGMLGGILFAWIKGSELDCNCKQWRFMADVLNDFSIFLDILSPSFGEKYFLYIICFSSLSKSIVGVAGGATRSAVASHQARTGNMADVCAKDGSQETLVNLSALIVGFFLVPLVNENIFVIWTLFTLLTFFHLFANFNAVKTLEFESLNLTRLQILCRNYLRSGQVYGVTYCNRIEPIFLTYFFTSTPYYIGTKLEQESSLCENISLDFDKGFVIQRKKKKFYMSLAKEVSAIVQINAIFTLEFLLFIEQQSSLKNAFHWWNERLYLSEMLTNTGAEKFRELEITISKMFQDFHDKILKSKWDLNVVKINAGVWSYK